MIALCREGVPLPRVIWRRDARRSLNALLDFLEAKALGDRGAREAQIEQAIEVLRYAPLRCPVIEKRRGLAFRRLIVARRFFVYYVYISPRGMTSGGTLSIRAVRHAASQNPFLGVREVLASDYPPSTLSTRDSPAPATA